MAAGRRFLIGPSRKVWDPGLWQCHGKSGEGGRRRDGGHTPVTRSGRENPKENYVDLTSLAEERPPRKFTRIFPVKDLRDVDIYLQENLST